MPVETASLPSIPWKIGNDAVRAKDISKLNVFFENFGFELYFWHDTIKLERNFENMKNFYLQRIKPKLECELIKQQ